MDNAIQAWLAIKVEYQRVDLDRVGDNYGSCMGIFYTYDFMVGFRDSKWLQHLINVLISLFRIYGLMSNVSKSRTMTCQPRALRSGISQVSLRKSSALGWELLTAGDSCDIYLDRSADSKSPRG